jgi:organic hydroperoxide reductase OsmC/OhrA
MKLHQYNIQTTWTGNRGEGTQDYKAYDRSHVIRMEGKADILGSSDAAFRGDKSKHTPEDLFVSTLSTCHMLWYLHLCALNGVVVLEYIDNATGLMEEESNGSGRFTKVILSPEVIVSENSMIEKANELHGEAHRMCFISNSVNFQVVHEPVASVQQVLGIGYKGIRNKDSRG